MSAFQVPEGVLTIVAIHAPSNALRCVSVPKRTFKKIPQYWGHDLNLDKPLLKLGILRGRNHTLTATPMFIRLVGFSDF